jgi:putative chitinase
VFPIDGDFVLKIAPRFSGEKAAAQAAIVSAIGPVFAATLDGYEINTLLRIAHFMGQVTHECAGFRTTEEFASGAAYEGRKDLGNTQPGDGKRYKGRGLIQLTGRANYRDVGASLKLDLEANPGLASQPVNSLKIACEYWKSRNINAAADQDNLVKATKLVNGGTNGLDDRGNFLRKAKLVLSELKGTLIAAAQGGTSIVLRRGSHNDAVGELQTLLRKAGFPIAVDNDSGAATELAVMAFQKQKNIDVDGIVSDATWAALK